MSKQQLEKLEQLKHYKSQILKTSLNLKESNKALNLKQTARALPHSYTERNEFSLKPQIWMNDELFELKQTASKQRLQLTASPLLNSLDTQIITNRFTLGRSADQQGNLRSSRVALDEFSFLCPVGLHQKIALSRFDSDCKCKKYQVPFIQDLEYDYFIKLLPPEQLTVVVIIDSL
jgi:hypothetical protein